MRRILKNIMFIIGACGIVAGVASCVFNIDVRVSHLKNSAEEPYEVVIENVTLGQDMPDLEAVEAAVSNITPVSYTHLDVYKRQALFFIIGL